MIIPHKEMMEMYIIIVEYNDDGERKRAEYILFKKREDSNGVNTERVRGLTGIIHEEEFPTKLLRELSYKIDPDKIKIYKVKDVKGTEDFEIEEHMESMEPFVFRRNREEIDPLISHAIFRKNGVLVNDIRDGSIRRKSFVIYSKKGKLNLEVNYIKNKKGGTKVEISLSGYNLGQIGDIEKYLSKELTLMQRAEEG